MSFTRREFCVGLAGLIPSAALADFIIQPKAKREKVGFADIFNRVKPNTVKFGNGIGHRVKFTNWEGIPIDVVVPAGFSKDIEKECRNNVLACGANGSLLYSSATFRPTFNDFIKGLAEYKQNTTHVFYDSRYEYPFRTIEIQKDNGFYSKIAMVPYDFEGTGSYEFLTDTLKYRYFKKPQFDSKLSIAINSSDLIMPEWDDGQIGIACLNNVFMGRYE